MPTESLAFPMRESNISTIWEGFCDVDTCLLGPRGNNPHAHSYYSIFFNEKKKQKAALRGILNRWSKHATLSWAQGMGLAWGFWREAAVGWRAVGNSTGFPMENCWTFWKGPTSGKLCLNSQGKIGEKIQQKLSFLVKIGLLKVLPARKHIMWEYKANGGWAVDQLAVDHSAVHSSEPLMELSSGHHSSKRWSNTNGIIMKTSLENTTGEAKPKEISCFTPEETK